MLYFTFSFFIGTCCIWLLHTLPSFYFFIALTLVIALIYFYLPKIIRIILLGYYLGFFGVCCHTALQLQHTLPNHFESKPLRITADVISLPEHYADHDRFILLIHEICDIHKLDQCEKKNIRARISWYYPKQHLNVGEQWELTVRLLRPHSLRNEGTMDFAAWLFTRNIRATGYIYAKKPYSYIDTDWKRAPIAYIREKCIAKINALLAPGSLRGFIKALIVGDRSELESHDWDIFRLTGTNHLVVIAGLHIGLLIQSFRLLLSLLWKIKPSILLYFPSSVLSNTFAVMLAILYSLLAGFSLPTQRACTMLCALLLTLLWKRQVPSWHSLMSALLLMLVLDPLAVIDSSFWLSFNAVIALSIGMNRDTFTPASPLHTLQHFLKAQWILAIGMLPLMLWLFQQISFVAWIANLLVIPIVGFLVVPLCLVGCLMAFCYAPIGQWLWQCAEQCLVLTFWILEHLAHLPWAAWQHGVPYLWLLIPGYVGAWLLLKSNTLHTQLKIKNIYIKIIGSLLLVLCCGFPAKHPNASQLMLTVLDVGQALSIIVETQHHTLIYDTGLKTSPDQDSAQSVILPYLQQHGIHHVDTMLVSHGDNDHIGGAATLQKTLPIKYILTSVPDRFITGNVQSCFAGQSFSWDNAFFKILSPPQNTPYIKNNSSCVLEITFGNQRIILPGDIEHDAENNLLPLLKKTNVLIAPHHGSKTSSSEDFLNALQPEHVVISSGYHNRYHLPHPTIIERYQSHHVNILDTANNGSITLTFNNNKIESIEKYREQYQHVWD